MEINRENMKTLFTGFSNAYNTGIGLVPPMYERIAMTIPSSSRENLYAWLRDIPAMREWLGDRIINNLSLESYRIENKSFESTVSVKCSVIEDDQYGVYDTLFTLLGENTARHPNDLTFGLLNEGYTAPCYDGKNFFDTDHPVLDEKGKEQSISNFMGGTETAWYLACTSRSIKPLIFQKRQPAELVELSSPSSHNVFMKGEFIYGVDARYNVGFGLWQLMIASKQPLTGENYAAARAALQGMTKDHGGTMALTADLLVVPQTLEAEGRRILNAELVGVGGTTETNIWKGSAELLVCPWLKES
jgi:Mu-like prophage major head subunit gpT